MQPAYLTVSIRIYQRNSTARLHPVNMNMNMDYFFPE